MNSMMVYECDAVGCGATGKPRVLMLPLMSGGEFKPQETMFPPSGWVELRTFLGLDGEIWVGSGEMQLAPSNPLIVPLAPVEHFQFTEIKIDLSGPDAWLAEKVRVSISHGRTRWEEQPATAPLPDGLLKISVAPFCPLRFHFTNPTNVCITCNVIGRGYSLVDEHGVNVKHRIRYLCPDHAPKIRQ